MRDLERALLEEWRANMLVEQCRIRQALERLSPPANDDGVLVRLALPETGEEQVSYHIVIKNISDSSTEVEDGY